MRIPTTFHSGLFVAFLALAPACTEKKSEPPVSPVSTTRPPEVLSKTEMGLGADTWAEAGKKSTSAKGQKPEKPPVKPVEKPTPPKPPATAKAKAVIKKILAKDGVHLDLDKKVVWVPGTICVTNAVLEYLAVARTGKDHEALLLCECKPSALNTAFIAMGLEKGTNYSFKEKKPMPPEEDVRSGKTKPYIVIHPKGPGLYMTVEWTDAKGKKVRRRAEDLVLNLKTKKPVTRRTWTYIGSRMAALYKGEKPVFLADMECNLVSLCYFYPGNHLLTICHPDGMNQSIWWPNEKVVPEKGTPIKLYFSIKPLE